MKTLLLFDFNNVLYKGVHVCKELTYDGRFTGGLYNMLITVVKRVEETNPDLILFCTDSPPYYRSLDFQGYKGDRKKQVDEELIMRVKESKMYCEELLSLLHIPLLRVNGYEADDLMAGVCEEYEKGWKKVIVSNDDDLVQLFRYEGVRLMRGNHMYTYENFKEEYPDVSLDTWELVLAMAGTHNGIPGLKKIGIKTAIKIVKDEKRFKKLMLEGDNYQKVNLWRKLIHLPYANITFTFPPPTPPSFNKRKFIRFLQGYGIECTLKMEEVLGRFAYKKQLVSVQ